MSARRSKKRNMIIKTAAQAIDVLGGNAKVSEWLDIEIGTPAALNTVSGWRKRGISRNFAVHFFAELVERRGYKLKPQVFGLEDWSMVLMPDRRGRKLKKVA